MSSVNDSTTPRSQLRVGRLTKAHGLKGAIKLELFTDDPGRRFVPGAVFTLQVPTGSPWHGKKIELVELRWYNQHAVGFFKDVPDREAAEALAKAILWIDQDDAEQSDEEDAWYDHQLIGLAVVRDDVQIGTISRLEHLPAQDLLIVKTPAGDVMIPFVKAIVPSVDIKRGIVTITPPPGLLEELPEEPEESDEALAADEAPAADEEAAEKPSDVPAPTDTDGA
ncbi:ribosome maturation factor RimM [Cryobacterium sp. TMT1-21]|uniref:Ribosome maturation factor RimM n=1 Tax=Cryobacterium shii TaxID=1259235 RepID=A0AAQ2C8L0_9MICO|nr:MULTISPECIES: ribosome maturation factor RimM [Cryobacterium]TFD20487.1 ribosome maturation factor RimM [Cryobacterium sp. TMT4-10]TFD35229.1 ribosome maturation factor RimM [Cryobacterium sp. TMT2-10]TFC52358.1 ribosome maturation factor RimM [Cryobacterium shii]TFC87526.1 ribosome maturation factor RimM [Cryobacterium sp. TmT2-59]TFD10874.1 ribosome maturation factor RimM [Cryobacterium sp. TMT1-21]